MDDQPLVDAAVTAALGAVERAREVVAVDATSLLRLTARFDGLLHSIEQLLIDEGGFVSAFVLLVLVVDLADVVPVAQHPLQLVD